MKNSNGPIMIYNTIIYLLLIFLCRCSGEKLFFSRLSPGGIFPRPRPHPRPQPGVLEGKPATCENEGAQTKLALSPCIKCFCQGGLIACKREVCPSMHHCRGIVVQRPGKCCRECQVRDFCLYFKRVYKDGDRWFASKCRECSCKKGRVICEDQVCDPNLTCPTGMKKSRSPGACCESCMQETGTCTTYGDPHYQTFDNRMYNFQGKCKYVLAKDCHSNNFTIQVRNEGRHSRTYAWTKSVFLHLPIPTKDKNRTEVALLQKLRVKVNGKRVGLPYLNPPHLYISENGYLLTVTTSLGVKVVWDGDSYTEVHVPTSYKNKTCGFCGNFNNDRSDDLKAPDGTLMTNANKFGESWKVHACEKPPKSKKNNIQCRGEVFMEARRKCSILKGKKFSACHKYVNPRSYFNSCVTDMCHCPKSRHHSCTCQSLTAYTRACEKQDVVLRWRSKKYCSITCRNGAVYDDCGSACRETCDNKDDANKVCAKTGCVAGCQCPAGTVWHRRKCIHPSKCPKSAKKYFH